MDAIQSKDSSFPIKERTTTFKNGPNSYCQDLFDSRAHRLSAVDDSRRACAHGAATGQIQTGAINYEPWGVREVVRGLRPGDMVEAVVALRAVPPNAQPVEKLRAKNGGRDRASRRRTRVSPICNKSMRSMGARGSGCGYPLGTNSRKARRRRIYTGKAPPRLRMVRAAGQRTKTCFSKPLKRTHIRHRRKSTHRQ